MRIRAVSIRIDDPNPEIEFIEADHGALKWLIRPTRGFQSMKTAYATIKGFEVMRLIRRRPCILIEPGVTGEARFVNKLFDPAAWSPRAERADSGRPPLMKRLTVHP